MINIVTLFFVLFFHLSPSLSMQQEEEEIPAAEETQRQREMTDPLLNNYLSTQSCSCSEMHSIQISLVVICANSANHRAVSLSFSAPLSSPTETVTITTKTVIITDKGYGSTHTQTHTVALHYIQMVFMLVKLFIGSPASLKGCSCKQCMRRTTLTFTCPFFSSGTIFSIPTLQRAAHCRSLELTCDNHCH